MSEKCRKNFKEAIDSMLHELRERIISELALDEEQRKNNPSAQAMNQANQGTIKKKSGSAFDKLDFPDHMTYGHRSNLRKECSRFLRFAYLVDFLALESLTAIYLDTVKDFLEKLQDLDACQNNALTENDVYQNRSIQPMFKVDVKFDPSRQPDKIIEVKPEEFLRPPHGHSKDEDFDPTVHLELEPEKEEGADGEGEEDDAISFDSDGKEKIKKPIVYKLEAPTLYKCWLYIAPDKKMILTKLQETLTDGLESL